MRDYPSLHPELLTVRSRTGATLAARFFLGGDKGTVVLTHGYAGNQDELLPLAASMHEAGLNVLTYDMRGCGTSTGVVTFGAREVDDLLAVVDYARGRTGVDASRIGVFGFSMGGAVTLLAGARDQGIAAVAADSAWSDVHHWLRPSWTRALRRPIEPFSTPSLALAELRAGIHLSDLRPVASVARIAGRPLLLVSARDDVVVPSHDSAELLSAAGPPKQLWQVDGGHGDTLRDAAYGPRVAGFFVDAFRHASPDPHSAQEATTSS